MIEFLQELGVMEWFSDMTSGTFALITYVLQALALYSIAKRREIKRPWLAWVPVADVWILGSISDQYRYVVRGEVRNKRKTLLVLNILMTVLCAVLIGVLVFVGVMLLFTESDLSNTLTDWEQWVEQPVITAMMAEGVGIFVFLLVWLLLLVVLAIFYAVVFWKAVYDLFRSCDPDNSVVYLLVSLFGNFVIEGIYSVFMLVCKEKDLGMPPRKTEPEIVVETVVENTAE